MAIFVIALLRPNEGVSSRIVSRYPKRFAYNSTLFFVQADVLAEELAIELGIKGPERISEASGFVVKLQEFSYSGYTTRSLWEWLGEAEKA